jgi:murein DD-endopeptidase MepM/ murein hydrolase activator NlpD
MHSKLKIMGWIAAAGIVMMALAAAAPATSPLIGPISSPLIGWPVGGQMSQGFGCSAYDSGIAGPGCPAEAPWFHDGVDIAAPVGRPVRAAMAGTVIFAGPDGHGPVCNGGYRGYGLGVVIDNGQGWQTLYAHLSRLEVVAGQAVTPQTIIGAVGETGCVTGPHLHFGLKHRGVLVDPVEYIPER